MPFTFYVIITSGVAGIFIVISIYLFFRHKVQLPKFAIFLLLTVAEWMVAEVLEFGSLTFEAKLFWNKLQYIGIAMLPVAWLGFCFEFANYKKFIKLKYFILLSIIPVIFLVLVFTNEFHSLIWGNTSLNESSPFLEKNFNIGFWIFMIYLYTLIFWGFILILQILIKARYLHRKQSAALLFASFFPIVTGIIDITGIFTDFDITPFAFSITSLILLYGFARLRFNESVPIAYQTTLESISDIVIVLDQNEKILYANPVAIKLFSQKQNFFKGKYLAQFLPDLLPVIANSTDSVSEREEINLNNKIYDVRISPVLDWQKRIVSNIVVLRDITKLKQAEEKLREMKQELEKRVKERTKELSEANITLNIEIKERKKAEEIIRRSLEEKEVLLKEIYHRVKNNLQVIMSIIKLQSRYIQNQKIRDFFLETSNRIKSIGMVHERLYKSSDLAKVDVFEYFKNLADHIFTSFNIDREYIRLRLNVEKILLDIDTCIPCGLIINELITNSIKHAFPNINKGNQNEYYEIKIEFYSKNNDYILIISDNGVGLNRDIDIEQMKSLGLDIVKALISQLKGTMEIILDKGTKFKFQFKKTKKIKN